MIGGRLPTVTPRQKRKRRKASRAPSPSKKVHCNRLHEPAAYANDRAVCGNRTGFVSIGRDVYRDRCVRLVVFQKLPKQAQCVSCRGGIPFGWEHATDEQVIAVECFLIGTGRVFAAWADA